MAPEANDMATYEISHSETRVNDDGGQKEASRWLHPTRESQAKSTASSPEKASIIHWSSCLVPEEVRDVKTTILICMPPKDFTWPHEQLCGAFRFSAKPAN